MEKRLMLLMISLLCGIDLVTAQVTNVSGVVTSREDGEPVIGASVLVKGTTTGTITDVEGRFNFQNLPSSATTLVVSFVGMTTQEVQIKTGIMNVVLSLDTEVLEEVVVTAMGISREKKALGYAVSEVGGDEMIKARGGISNPVNALQGKVAGLQISSGTGSMGGSSKVLIRGVTSISGNNQPLFVVDGVPIEGSDFNSADTQRGGGGMIMAT